MSQTLSTEHYYAGRVELFVGGETAWVSILLIPCFQNKEAECFALLKDPYTHQWREFSPEFGETNKRLLSRVKKTMLAEAQRDEAVWQAEHGE